MDSDYLNSIIDYNQESGICFWKERPRTDFRYAREHKAWNKKHAETQIYLTNPSTGKHIISLNGKGHTLDRLLWFMVTNEVVNTIYHKNQCNCDDSWDNLTTTPNKATKYTGGEIILTRNNKGLYLVTSGSPQKLMPPAEPGEGVHVFNIFLHRKDARVYMLELVDKLQTGWTNLIEEY